MDILLLVYSWHALASVPTTFPLDHTGFMPFQENYWLWKVIGFAGLATFQMRWIVQWLHSEKHKESRVPIAFWWLSLIGSVLELMYFLRQQDSVGVLGYCFSVVPYTRNLMLVYAKRKRETPPAPEAILEP
ncbi:MAG: lipid-A-disaccharide synthase N-terminal domain-containing protein [Phycisphaerae bacterium]|nr:lipid-A-disaccharide synthase N-terminal domain-containing protein [Phycisphaerae bacterium]